MDCQCEWLGRFEAVFLEISEVEAVSQEGESAEVVGDWRKVVGFVTADFYAFPVEWVAAEGFEADFFEEIFDEWEGVFIGLCVGAGVGLDGFAFFVEEGEEVAFSVHFVWEDADAFSQVRAAASPFRDTVGEAFVVFHFDEFHVRAVFEEVGDGFFVFDWGECAGGVEHQSTGTEHVGCLEGEFFLDGGEFLGFFGGPVSGECFFFSEHSFTGAWGIEDDLVEEFREGFGEFGWCFVGYEDVWDAEEFQVAKEGSGAGGADVGGYEETFAFKGGTGCGGFAAWGCAEVEDFVAWFDWDAGGGGHGAWFLEVVEAGLVVGASGGADIFVVEVGVFDPGDWGDGKWG